MKAVYCRPGYEAQVRTLDTSAGGTFAVDFAPARQIVLPSGDAAKTSATSSNVAVVFDVASINAVSARIEIGDAQVQPQVIFNEFEDALGSLNGLKFLAFGGSQIRFDKDPVNGNILYLVAAANKLKRASSSDVNAAVLATVYHPGGSPVDGANGDVQLIGGIDIEALGQAMLVNLDLDTSTAGVQSVFGVDQATLAILEDPSHGLAALATAIGNVGGGGQGGNAPTVAQIVSGIQAADFGAAAGTQTLESLLAALKSAVDAIPTSQPTIPTPPTASAIAAEVETQLVSDFEAVTDAIAALPSPTSASAVATAIMGAAVESGLDVQKALRLTLSLLGQITLGTDAQGRQTITLHRLDSGATAALRVTADADGSRPLTEIL